MAIGRLEYVVLAFPGNQFKGEIIPELQKLVDRGLVRIVDLIFILKDQDGSVEGVELANFDSVIRAAFAPVVAEVRGLLSHEDVERVGEALEPNSSAGVLLLEHLWTIDLKQAIENAGGRLVDQGIVAPEDLEETLAEIAALQANEA